MHWHGMEQKQSAAVTSTQYGATNGAENEGSACDEYVVIQKEVAQMEQDHALLLEEKESAIQDMEKKVKTSQQFLDQKDTMDSALQQLQQTLELERKQHKEHIG